LKHFFKVFHFNDLLSADIYPAQESHVSGHIVFRIL
jgi:hypothetical protein